MNQYDPNLLQPYAAALGDRAITSLVERELNFAQYADILAQPQPPTQSLFAQ